MLPLLISLLINIQTQLPDSTLEQRYSHHYFEAIRLLNKDSVDQSLAELQIADSIVPNKAATHYQFYRVYRRVQATQAAFSSISKASELDPTNTVYKEDLIEFYLYQNNIKKAIETIESLLAEKSNNEKYLYQLLLLYKANNQFEDMLKIADRLEVIIGTSEELSFEKIAGYINTKQYKKVESELKMLSKKYSGDEKYVVLLGDYYLDQKEYKQAFKYYKSLLDKDSENGLLFLSLSNYYLLKGDDAKWEEYFFKAVDNKNFAVENKIKLLQPYISVLIDKKKIETIYKIFKSLIELYPLDESVRILYVAFLEQQKETAKVEEEYRTLIYLNSLQVEYWEKLLQIKIEALKEVGNNKEYINEIIELCHEASKTFPDYPYWYYCQVVALISQNEYEQAFNIIEEALTILPAKEKNYKAFLLSIKADHYASRREFQTAFEIYEQALTYNESAIILNNYAYMLAICNIELSKAERMSGKAVAAEPNNPTYLDTYAWIFFMKEDYRTARIYIERAANLIQEPTIIEHLGDILYMSGEKDKAIEQWKKAVKLGNTSEVLTKKIEAKLYIPESFNTTPQAIDYQQ